MAEPRAPRRGSWNLFAQSSRSEGACPVEPNEKFTLPKQRDLSHCIVAAGIYEAGHRIASPTSFDEAFRSLSEHPEAFAWIGLVQPNAEEMSILAHEFQLNPLAVEDTIIAHQRPKLERYEDTLFLVLRAARYVDQSETVVFGEIHAFIGERFVITVRHTTTPNLARVREELEANPDALATGPCLVLMRLLDVVVDDYMPVVAGIDNDIDEIDAQVFTGNAHVSKRIYQLTREVIDFQRAVRPVAGVVTTLRHDRVFYHAGDALRQQLRDIEDHVMQINERIESMRDGLVGVLDLHLALQAQASNEQMKSMSEASLKQAEDARRIAAWAGVFFVPSLITGIYGMNFERIPELHWAAGYPFALILMLVSAFIMWLIFKAQKWL